MTSFFKALLEIVDDRLIALFKKLWADYLLKKQVNEKLKDILNEKDANIRAKRISDFLNS